MKIKSLTAVVVGMLVLLHAPRRPRDERGLSQSAEIAILLGGAVVIATGVVVVITAFVKSKLPK